MKIKKEEKKQTRETEGTISDGVRITILVLGTFYHGEIVV